MKLATVFLVGGLINLTAVQVGIAFGFPFWAGWFVGLPLCAVWGWFADEVVS